jgi:hypothetical protein
MRGFIATKAHKAAVSFVKCFEARFLATMIRGFGNSVEDGKQFAHAGGMNDFMEFSGLRESLGEGVDDRIAASGRDGRHVKGAADSLLTPHTSSLKPDASRLAWREEKGIERGAGSWAFCRAHKSAKKQFAFGLRYSSEKWPVLNHNSL